MDALSAGVGAFNAGRFDEALRRFDEALARTPKDPQLRVLRAHALDSLARAPEAADQLRETIADSPRHFPAYSGLAGLLIRRGPDPAALDALRGLLTLPPGRGEDRERLIAALRECAQAFRACEDFDAEEELLHRARALGPGNRGTRRRLLEILRARAQAHLAADRLGPAERALRRVLSIDRADDASRRELIKILLAAGKLEAAERALRRELRRPGAGRAQRLGLVDVLLRRAHLYRGDGNFAKAEKSLRAAVALAPRDARARRLLVELLRERGRELQSAGRRKDAARAARAVLDADRDDPWARLSLGSVAFTAGETKKGRRLLAAALRLDRGELSAGDRYKALVKLGRYRAAIALAERILDAGASLRDLRAFWDPWEWDDRRSREDKLAELARLNAVLTGPERAPWRIYYGADLGGPQRRALYGELARFDSARYGWMSFKAGTAALLAGEYREAAVLLRRAAEHPPTDWRALCFLGEAYLCLGRRAPAYAAMERAERLAPPEEAGQVLAWRGAFDLWLGRYDEALPLLEEACRRGAQCAYCWKAGALLKLGRTREALRELDRTLRLYPLDFEALVWRGEALRELGRPREALRALENPALADARRTPPVWLWALFNRALAKKALGDEAGMRADAALVPAPVAAHIRRAGKVRRPEDLLTEGLRLSRGFRRDEYDQAIWMNNPR